MGYTTKTTQSGFITGLGTVGPEPGFLFLEECSDNLFKNEMDLPFVSGHSVSEHLKYCLNKYCPDKTVEEARNYYFEHTHREMDEITDISIMRK